MIRPSFLALLFFLGACLSPFPSISTNDTGIPGGMDAVTIDCFQGAVCQRQATILSGRDLLQPEASLMATNRGDGALRIVLERSGGRREVLLDQTGAFTSEFALETSTVDRIIVEGVGPWSVTLMKAVPKE